MKNNTIILGIDPGIANTGYACLLFKEDTLRLLDVGVFITKKGPTEHRIKKIYDFFQQLILTFRPDCMVMEQLFFSKNVKTALVVEEVRGSLMLLCAQQNMSFAQYTPLQIKKTLTHYGQASKMEVKLVSESILDISLPTSDDACDAVAASLCHAYTFDWSDI
ncbi:MAG TPA: crossover junction endodeoxyribonuclease RuvC [Caldisericia bacterium]|nr:crossover junction endodeoxyribonuclease RuvC [Caldisericia bacterium]HXK51312.1 crossover junction endodeoxyribonuclease RuvC [Caldisericia bacterium]